MAGFTDYLEDALLEHVLMNTSYTSPTTVYVGLLTATPTDSTSGTEVSGGAYARQTVTFQDKAATNHTKENTANITFPTATASWGTVTTAGIYDASTSGNLLCYVDLSVPGDAATANPKLVNTGDIFRINAGELTVALD